MNDREATLALNLLPGLGPVKVRALLDAFGSPLGILNASSAELQRVRGVGTELAGAIRDWENRVDLSGELQEIEQREVRFVTKEDNDYPQNLLEIYDPPLGLYVWGELLERDRHAIAVVGMRRCTHYGVQAARRLSFQLAHAGVTVISGLARGIDTSAHEGALAAKGRTIAVIGSGLGQLYPPENFPLAQRIADGSGAVISEFPIHWGPNKQTFPLRNRIVSGWSRGVLVVEAPERSGSLITANLAAEQGRSLYAVPGPIDRESSAGCNRLIQDGARLVVDARDVLEEFQQLWSGPSSSRKETARKTEEPEGFGDLSETETKVLVALGDEECGCDELIERCELGAGEVSGALLSLELKSRVTALPGSRYVRLIG